MRKESTSSQNAPTFCCLICGQDKNFVSVGDCDHRRVCLYCIMKYRLHYNEFKCPLCQKLNEIIFICDFPDKTPYKQLIEKKDEFYEDDEFEKCKIYYTTITAKEEALKIHGYNCPIKKCRGEAFDSLQDLIEHLEKSHNRFYCQYCLKENKTFISEMNIYNYQNLQNHIKYGEFDENTNVRIPPHPTCPFDNITFFNDDKLYKHLNEFHSTCPLCRSDKDNIYYSEPEKLVDHFKSEHFYCPYNECQRENFAVFDCEANYLSHLISKHKVKDKENRLNKIILEGSNNDKEKKSNKEKKNKIEGEFNFSEYIKNLKNESEEFLKNHKNRFVEKKYMNYYEPPKQQFTEEGYEIEYIYQDDYNNDYNNNRGGGRGRRRGGRGGGGYRDNNNNWGNRERGNRSDGRGRGRGRRGRGRGGNNNKFNNDHYDNYDNNYEEKNNYEKNNYNDYYENNNIEENNNNNYEKNNRRNMNKPKYNDKNSGFYYQFVEEDTKSSNYKEVIDLKNNLKSNSKFNSNNNNNEKKIKPCLDHSKIIHFYLTVIKDFITEKIKSEKIADKNVTLPKETIYQIIVMIEKLDSFDKLVELTFLNNFGIELEIHKQLKLLISSGKLEKELFLSLLYDLNLRKLLTLYEYLLISSKKIDNLFYRMDLEQVDEDLYEDFCEREPQEDEKIVNSKEKSEQEKRNRLLKAQLGVGGKDNILKSQDKKVTEVKFDEDKPKGNKDKEKDEEEEYYHPKTKLSMLLNNELPEKNENNDMQGKGKKKKGKKKFVEFNIHDFDLDKDFPKLK